MRILRTGKTLGLCALSWPTTEPKLWRSVDQRLRPTPVPASHLASLAFAVAAAIIAPAMLIAEIHAGAIAGAVGFVVMMLITLPNMDVYRRRERLRLKGTLTYARVYDVRHRIDRGPEHDEEWTDIHIAIETAGAPILTCLRGRAHQHVPHGTYPLLRDPLDARQSHILVP